ncbi:hypothetical protein [Mucilaginibacter humi]|nr:hypothetical protein [Mucilaginibacter humi]
MAKKGLTKIKALPKNKFFKFDAHYRVVISFGAALIAFAYAH